MTAVHDCPECGKPFEVDPTRMGRIPTYCGRACQVRNLNRRRAAGRVIRITIDDEARRLIDNAAAAVVVSSRRYVELLVAEHCDHLAAEANR